MMSVLVPMVLLSLTAAPGAELFVDGQSTMRPFTCGVQKLKLELPEAPRTLDGIVPLLTAAKLELSAFDLDCADKTMNEHMANALESKQFPQIRFAVRSVTAKPEASGVVAVTLAGDLTLHGKTLPVSVAVSASASKDGGIRLTGRHLLRMTDWGVKPPSLFFGSMKVKDSVVLRFDLALAAPGATTSAR